MFRVSSCWVEAVTCLISYVALSSVSYFNLKSTSCKFPYIQSQSSLCPLKLWYHDHNWKWGRWNQLTRIIADQNFAAVAKQGNQVLLCLILAHVTLKKRQNPNSLSLLHQYVERQRKRFLSLFSIHPEREKKIEAPALPRAQQRRHRQPTDYDRVTTRRL